MSATALELIYHYMPFCFWAIWGKIVFALLFCVCQQYRFNQIASFLSALSISICISDTCSERRRHGRDGLASQLNLSDSDSCEAVQRDRKALTPNTDSHNARITSVPCSTLSILVFLEAIKVVWEVVVKRWEAVREAWAKNTSLNFRWKVSLKEFWFEYS